MGPQPRPPSANDDIPSLPDDVSVTGTRRSKDATIDRPALEPGGEADLILETYEEMVDRTTEEGVAEDRQGLVPPPETTVDPKKD